MTEIRDGEALSVDVPERSGTCLAFPAQPAGMPPPPPEVAAACGALNIGAFTPAPPDRLVAAGVVALGGGAAPARFALRFVAEAPSYEPTPEAARDFATREATSRSSAVFVDGGSEGGPIDILAVGSSPATGIPSGELVTVGSGRYARATFTLDLRESGRDVPIHFVSYGAWARDGVYVLTVEGDAFHAAAVDALADEAARTLLLKDPAPPTPTDVAQVGARLGQIGIGVLVAVAIVLALFGIRTRKVRG
ncbi:MAG: hypothetical protein L3K06_08760 [Thermoplasmata archaeon]|nr:hypothetical protein [Thermoplasmata archaeon]